MPRCLLVVTLIPLAGCALLANISAGPAILANGARPAVTLAGHADLGIPDLFSIGGGASGIGSGLCFAARTAGPTGNAVVFGPELFALQAFPGQEEPDASGVWLRAGIPFGWGFGGGRGGALSTPFVEPGVAWCHQRLDDACLTVSVPLGWDVAARAERPGFTAALQVGWGVSRIVSWHR